MTNDDIQRLKKYIKFTKMIKAMPVEIENWAEKLSGRDIRGKKREFTDTELGYIRAALLGMASHLNKLK